MRYLSRGGIAAGALCACISAGAQEPAARVPAVEVVAPTPVPGLDLPRDRLPANVQTLRSREIEQAQPLNVPDLMGSRLPSVNVNEIQGNPYQPDVSFRGHTASPLLGTPQGLSIYQDGVRINEPFGDVANWDLIPVAAIDSIILVPGSNPLFGLNTLGGALSLRTKSGDSHPGGSVELSGGSFGRWAGEFGYGRRLVQGLHLFSAGTWFEEDGWRDFSPSKVKQLFAKVGQRTADYEWALGLTAADTDLVGNGLVPQSLYGERREAIFTRPDRTRNELGMLSFSASRYPSAAARVSTTLYYRDVNTRTLNGDVNDDFETGPDDGATGANGGAGNNVGTGVNNRTATRQHGYGAALQWSHVKGNHQFALGSSMDFSRSKFQQGAALGVFDATRLVLETDPESLEDALDGRTHTGSLFATDTWSLRPDLHLTLSGRYNRTQVRLRDTGPSAPALDGDHSFSKFNPAAGIAYQASRTLTWYAGFNQGSRAPTPVELGCADPARPCTLPNTLAADPPLNQVVARTLEAGARGRLAGDVRWHAGIFQTTNSDDILFVGTTTSAGYFTNFGKTRRRGLELGLAGPAGRLEWSAAYSFVRASFESSACLVAENNSSRGTSPACSPEDPGSPGTFLGDDLIAVRPGDRIPGIPEHSFKLALGYRAGGRLQLGANLVAYSSQYARGNENNRHQAGTAQDLNGDTRTFLGPGKTGAYALVNLRARYDLQQGWEAFARIDNLFDRRYATAGALAENPFDAAGQFQTNSDDWSRETFFAPGAPRAGWIGLRYRFKE